MTLATWVHFILVLLTCPLTFFNGPRGCKLKSPWGPGQEVKQVNQAKREIRCKCETAGSGGGRGTLLPSLQNSVGVVLLYPRLWTTSGRRPQWETGWVGLQARKEKHGSAGLEPMDPERPPRGWGGRVLSFRHSRDCAQVWAPGTSFCTHLCPKAPTCPASPSHILGVLRQEDFAVLPLQSQWEHAGCNLGPAVTHLGRGASVYGPRCLQMPLGSSCC